MLAEVFGVSLASNPTWMPLKRFIAPTQVGAHLFRDFATEHPAFFTGNGMPVQAHESAKVLATRTIPWSDQDASRFASIHSDPPWQETTIPELVANDYGRGSCVYSASPIEDSEVLSGAFARVINQLYPNYSYQANGPVCVEITMFRQPERKRYTLSFVNFQRPLASEAQRTSPFRGMTVKLRLPERVRRVVTIPTGESVGVRSRWRHYLA